MDKAAPAVARIFSNNRNGVAIQIWTALCACLLVAIGHRPLALPDPKI